MKLHTEDSNSLLSEPGSNLPKEKISRPACSFYVSEEFAETPQIKTRQFNRQYAHSYTVRLWSVRPTLELKVKAEWQNVELKKIADLCESSSGQGTSKVSKTDATPVKTPGNFGGDHGQHIIFHEDMVVAVIGTVFKQQPEKPSILQELCEENQMVPTVPKIKYISDKDVILLEDETTTVRLVMTSGCGMTINGSVNGIVCAFKGKPDINGKFEVMDVIYATPKESIWPKISLSEPNYEMIFISGLQLGSTDQLIEQDLLFDYLQGIAGCPDEQESSLKEKTRVFFLGNTFGLDETSTSNTNEVEKKCKMTQGEVGKKLDDLLDELSKTMEVFIIPGGTDPSEPMLPQTPLHRCIFPKSYRRPTFHSLSNPTRLKIPMSGSSESKTKDIKNKEALDMILTSGENVKDAMRNSDIDCPLEMAQKLLQWGHLCPTAPDTLSLHPGVPEDVFVLNSLPNLFIVGNQEEFGSREWKNTRIVTVPQFSKSFSAVVFTHDMNIVSLDFKLM